MAEYLGVETLLVRLGMAAAITIGGLGIAIYALAWALIPVAPGSERGELEGPGVFVAEAVRFDRVVRGKHPEPKEAKPIAELLRAVADDLAPEERGSRPRPANG